MINAHTHTNTHPHTHTHTHTLMHRHTHTHTHTHARTRMHAHTHTDTRTHIHRGLLCGVCSVCMCMLACVCVCACMCVCCVQGARRTSDIISLLRVTRVSPHQLLSQYFVVIHNFRSIIHDNVCVVYLIVLSTIKSNFQKIHKDAN